MNWVSNADGEMIHGHSLKRQQQNKVILQVAISQADKNIGDAINPVDGFNFMLVGNRLSTGFDGRFLHPTSKLYLDKSTSIHAVHTTVFSLEGGEHEKR